MNEFGEANLLTPQGSIQDLFSGHKSPSLSTTDDATLAGEDTNHATAQEAAATATAAAAQDSSSCLAQLKDILLAMPQAIGGKQHFASKFIRDLVHRVIAQFQFWNQQRDGLDEETDTLRAQTALAQLHSLPRAIELLSERLVHALRRSLARPLKLNSKREMGDEWLLQGSESFHSSFTEMVAGFAAIQRLCDRVYQGGNRRLPSLYSFQFNEVCTYIGAA